jgi:hypothetical protein
MSQFTKNTVNNPATMLEKKKQLREDQLRKATTLFAEALKNSKLTDDPHHTGSTIFSGAAPHVLMPSIPTGPWSSSYAPEWKPEEPLGQSVDDLPVVAEPHEVARAAQILRDRELGAFPFQEALAPEDEAGSLEVNSASSELETTARGVPTPSARFAVAAPAFGCASPTLSAGATPIILKRRKVI